MSGGEDEQHAQDHGMPSDATDFGVMDGISCDGSKLGPLNIEKASQTLLVEIIKWRERELT